ncbi:hypothetical protein [Nocardioides sp.]|uniref:hypothetical protein n=1 Tax=Nocardioides sp. TaxID=35761 RepID=UPI0039E6FAA7
MSEMSREQLFEVVRSAYSAADPVPDGLVERMRAAAATAAEDAGFAFELELMTLLERSEELAGARGTGMGSAYTLRFVHGEIDLLLRIARDGEAARVDGWVVPPEPMTVRALVGAPDSSLSPAAAAVSDSGRFELTGLPAGLARLRLEPHDTSRPPFATPTFEI